jgi:hypothetical protein
VRVSESYGKLPLSFEANRGQTDPKVKFLTRGRGQTIFLTSNAATLVFTKAAPKAGNKPSIVGSRGREALAKAVESTALRMTFLGANPDARVTGQVELPAKAHYFIGNDPAQ